MAMTTAVIMMTTIMAKTVNMAMAETTVSMGRNVDDE
jgi:hypothetical protein